MLRRRTLRHALLTTTLAGCGGGSSASGDAGGTETDTSTGDPPTTTLSTSTMTDGTATDDATATNVDTTTDGPTTDSTTTADTTSTADSTGTTEGTTSDDASSSDDGSSSDGSSSDPGSSSDDSSSSNGSSSSDDGAKCEVTEPAELTCDGIDNDCNGLVDDIDAGADGICDCLAIGILGQTGFAPTSDFEGWLEDQGTSVTRTLLLNNPNVVDAEFLAQYDLIIVDRIERDLDDAEAAALETFVKQDGRGLITLIGYNFDNDNPAPERDRANTALAPFGLAYEGGYIHTISGVTPTFDQAHPISAMVFDVNYAGGIVPVDDGDQGTSTIFATVPQGDAGLAHQTMTGGRVIVWGDEWITFDSDWQGFADVQLFWSQMIDWARPQDFCGAPT